MRQLSVRSRYLSLAAWGVTVLISVAMSEAVCAQSLNLRVVRMDGSEVLGEYRALNDEGCVIASSARDESIPVADIARIEVRDTLPLSALPKIEIKLVDGSVLKANQVTVTAGVMRLAGGSSEIELETRNVQMVSFRVETEGTDLPDAAELVSEEVAADVLVVRREQEGVVRLNPVEGVLGEIGASGVSFKFDEQEIQVPLERVDSFFYYHPPGRRLSELKGVVTTQRGDRYQIRGWEVQNDGLHLELMSGVDVTLALEMVERIDFEAGRVMSLVDLEPTTLEWTPFIPPTGENNARLEQLRTLFAMERDRSFSEKPLSLFSASGFNGTRERLSIFSRGLALRSSSRIAYRLPEGYTRLVGVMGIDPDVRPRGDVTISISGDGKVMWEGKLTGADPEPVSLDLNVANVSRLSVEIGFGEGGDLGDRVHWCEPRLVK